MVVVRMWMGMLVGILVRRRGVWSRRGRACIDATRVRKSQPQTYPTQAGYQPALARASARSNRSNLSIRSSLSADLWFSLCSRSLLASPSSLNALSTSSAATFERVACAVSSFCSEPETGLDEATGADLVPPMGPVFSLKEAAGPDALETPDL